MKNCEVLQLPKILDQRGNLTFLEGDVHIPFKIQRVFWIYDVPGGETRGGHAYKTNEEFIIALSGSFDVILDNRMKKITYSLNRSYSGLYIPPGTWRHMENFSTNALALVLSSTFFCETDYIRDYNEFINLKEVQNNFIYPNVSRESNILSLGNKFKVSDCPLIDLNINHRDKGNITVVENHKTLSFDIKRVYYLYDVPGGESRGGHAHKCLYQFIIAACGSFDVILDDGEMRKVVHLNRSYFGLYIVPGIWRELTNFSSGSICLVIASELYDGNDYIRKYEDFVNFKSGNGSRS